MSDDVIRNGDLVMVVRPRLCCPNHTRYGYTFVVVEIHSNRVYCVHCKKDFPKGTVFAKSQPDLGGIELCRLKKINPPPTEESTKQTDEVTA